MKVLGEQGFGGVEAAGAAGLHILREGEGVDGEFHIPVLEQGLEGVGVPVGTGGRQKEADAVLLLQGVNCGFPAVDKIDLLQEYVIPGAVGDQALPKDRLKLLAVAAGVS